MSKSFISPKRYALNRDKTKAVEWGDPEADTLLVIQGGELTREEAERYGLIPNVPAPPAPEQISEPVKKPNKDRVLTTSSMTKR